MKLGPHTALTGPNLSGPVSGLRARLVEDGDPLCGADRQPGRAKVEEGLEDRIGTLVRALPELAAHRDGITARAAAEGGASLAPVLVLAEALRREASVVAGPATLLHRDATGATVFLQCDTGPLGAFALRFGIAGARQLAAGGADGGADGEAAMRKLHLEVRRRVRPPRLDQTTRALARAGACPSSAPASIPPSTPRRGACSRPGASRPTPCRRRAAGCARAGRPTSPGAAPRAT